MNNNNADGFLSGLVFGFVIGAILLTALLCAAFFHREETVQKQAIAAGVAEWRVTKEGNPYFYFIPATKADK